MTVRPPTRPPRVAVTRPTGEAGEDRLASLLRREGMEPVSFPLLRLAPPASPFPLRAVADRLAECIRRGESLPYSWLLITSRNVLPPLLSALARSAVSPPALQDAGLRVAAVGQSTALALRGGGFRPDVVPERYTAEDLLAALARPDADLSGVRFLLPRAEVARDVLPDGIRGMGGQVDVVTAYRVVEHRPGAEALCRAVGKGTLEGVTLTSGRAARVLGTMWASTGAGKWPAGVLVGVIGPVTADAAREAKLPVAGIPEQATLPALATAMGRALGVRA
jgi:uroporphyrinogen-III synthase